MNFNDLDTKYFIEDFKILNIESLKSNIINYISSQINNKEFYNFEDLQILKVLSIIDYSIQIDSCFEERYLKQNISVNKKGVNILFENDYDKNIWNYKLELDDTYDIPESLISVICPNCKSSGKLVCNSCNGNKKNRCNTCNGKGNKKCYMCNGYGVSKCHYCLGEGCKFCQRGFINCNSCINGYVNCSDCFSKGYTDCSNCNGSGSTSCLTCDEYGSLIKYKSIVSKSVNSNINIINNCSIYFEYIKNRYTPIFVDKFIYIPDTDFNNLLENSGCNDNQLFYNNIVNPELPDNVKLKNSEFSLFSYNYLTVIFKIDNREYSIALTHSFDNFIFIDKMKFLNDFHFKLVNKLIDSYSFRDLINVKYYLSLLPINNDLNVNSISIIDEIEDEEKFIKLNDFLSSKKYYKASILFKELSLIAHMQNEYHLIKNKLEKIYFRISLYIWLFLFIPYLFFYFKCNSVFLFKYFTIYSIATILLIAVIRKANNYFLSWILPIFLSILLFTVQYKELSSNTNDYFKYKRVDSIFSKKNKYKDQFVEFYPIDTNFNDWKYAYYIDTSNSIFFYDSFIYNNSISDWQPLSGKYNFKPKDKVYIIQPENFSIDDSFSITNYYVASMNQNFVLPFIPLKVQLDSNYLLYKCNYYPMDESAIKNHHSYNCYIPIKHRIK